MIQGFNIPLADLSRGSTTEDVILTEERLTKHILLKHSKEYWNLKDSLKDIVEDPDIILDDNRNKNTIILLKKYEKDSKIGRIVIKIAVAEDIEHPQNSIITLMQLNERTWKQTLKNRGKIIYIKNVDKNE